ncbi:MAG: hypothetical protein ACLS6G_08320 [Christensenellales bacterium]
MNTDIGTILKDAVANHYAVIACLPVNLEVCRGATVAANEKKAPPIFIWKLPAACERRAVGADDQDNGGKNAFPDCYDAGSWK